MAKAECSAYIPNDDERDLICEWLKDTEGCSYHVVGKTIIATYTQPDSPNNSDIYWGFIHIFEQYQDHSITHNAKGGG